MPAASELGAFPRDASPSGGSKRALSLYRLLDPEVLANPYPLFHQLRNADPVYWDPFLHSWVVTRYADVVRVLREFSAQRTPTPEQLAGLGLADLAPIARVMVKQMLFLDPPTHTRIRSLASYAFTPQRVEVLRGHIREVVRRLLDAVASRGSMDVIADLAEPLPYTITAEMLGVPVADAPQLKAWSQDFAEMLGNFQHNPDRLPRVRRSVDEMTAYFQNAVSEFRKHPREGLIHAFLTAEVNGDRFTEEEIVANSIVTMVGGQETTTNLIGNGVLTLLRHPAELARLRADLSLIPSAVEEMLRFEPPSQHTARLAPADVDLGGKQIRKRQAVIAVMAAGNRDPERFPEPDRFDISRKDNQHLSFGWAAHFCFGAALARIEGQVVFEEMLRRLPDWSLGDSPLVWRTNLGLRGLTSLHIRYGAGQHGTPSTSSPERQPSPATPPQGAPLSEAKRRLLKAVLSRRPSAAPSELKPITRRDPASAVPLTFAQEDIWRRSQGPEGTDPVYNESITIHRVGALDIPAIQRSLTEIVRRHEAWRTTFAFTDGRPVQVVHSSPDAFPLPVHDLESLTAPERDAEAVRLATELAAQPFDLAAGPLVRACLIRLDSARHRLHLTAHQSVVDGLSVFRVFPAELTTLYEAERQGISLRLPELPVQFSDFACWQRDNLGESILAPQLDYWSADLRGVGPSIVCSNATALGAPRARRGSLVAAAWPSSLSDVLHAVCKNESVTLFMVLLAGFALLWSRDTSREDFLLGTLAPAGRERQEVQGLLGYFMNPVPARFQVRPSHSFAALLRQARARVSAAVENDDVPFSRIVERLTGQPAGPQNSLFDAVLSLAPSLSRLPSGWSQTYMDVPSGGSVWPLYVEWNERPEGILIRALHDPACFEPAAVRRMLDELHRLLQAAAARPERPISEIFCA